MSGSESHTYSSRMINKSIREPFDRLCCAGVEEDKSFIDDGSFTTKRIKIGGHYLLWGRRRSYFPFQGMVGPDWIMVVFVYFLIIAVDAIILSVISPLGWPPVLIGLVGFVIVICAFSAVACTDPGIVYKNDFTALDTVASNRSERAESESPLVGNTDIEEGGVEAINTGESPKGNGHVGPAAPMQINRAVDIPNSIECGQCDFRRPYSARHCSHCKTCVDELDHHCPWCGKCIGDKNIKQFYLFVNTLCFQFYYLIGTLIYYFIFKYAEKIPSGPNW